MLVDTYYSKLFPGAPIQKRYRQSLETNDHPELDVTAFCNEDEIEIYQSLIGSMQWAVSIGRMDVQTAVMSMSSFREQPRVGHLKHLKRMVGFPASFRDYKIRIVPMNRISVMFHQLPTTIGNILHMVILRRIYLQMHLPLVANVSSSLIILTQTLCMMYYLERQSLESYIFGIKRQ